MLFNYSLPAFLSGLMVTPVKWYVDSLLVSKSGFNEMGVFTAALTFNNIILVGASMVSGPFIAIMAKKSGQELFNIPIVHKERLTGEVSIRKMKLLKVCWQSFKELLNFRLELNNKIKKLK